MSQQRGFPPYCNDITITGIGQRPSYNQLLNQLICGTITEYLNSEF